MKRKIVLFTLGTLGIAQYIYFQCTPLAFNYSYETIPDPILGKFGVMNLETTMTRDWTLGIIGLLIGLVLLILGTIQLIKEHKQIKVITDEKYT